MHSLQPKMPNRAAQHRPADRIVQHSGLDRRSLHETATLIQRRQYTGARLTPQVYAALYGCSLALAREILGARGASAAPPTDADPTRSAGTVRQIAGEGAKVGRLRAPRGPRPRCRRASDIAALAGTPGQDSSQVPKASASARLHQLEKAERIVRSVCDVWKVQPDDLRGSSRRRAVSCPRQAAAAIIAARCPLLTLDCIGRCLGLTTHTAVLHACKAHIKRLRRDEAYAWAAATASSRCA